MKPSSGSLRKFALPAILFIASIAILAQNAVSYLLDSSRPRLLNYLNSAFGYTFNAEKISFDFLHGIGIKNASLYTSGIGNPDIAIEDIFISARILPILIRQTLVIKADISGAKLSVTKEKEGLSLQIIFSDVCKKISEKGPLKLPLLKRGLDIYIKQAELTYLDEPSRKNNMRLILKDSVLRQEEENFVFYSTVGFNYSLPQDSPDAPVLFKNKFIQQEAKYYAQGTIKGEDLVFTMISLNVGASQILGTGVTKSFTKKNPYLEIKFMPSSIFLGDILALQENFNAQGDAFVSVGLRGLMDSPKFTVNAKLNNCNFTYALTPPDVYNIKNISGDFSYADNQIRFKNCTLMLNNNQFLNVGADIRLAAECGIALNVSVPQGYLAQQGLPLKKIEAVLLGKITDTLKGSLEVNAVYMRRDLNIDMKAILKNIDFDYRNSGKKYFFAESLQLIKDNSTKVQRLTFHDLKAALYANKKKIELPGLEAKGYTGNITGQIRIDTADKPALRFTLSAAGLDVTPLMQDLNLSDKLLSGEMKIDIAFDNQKSKFLTGDCQIKNGTVDLDILAQIIKLPSFKNTSFETIDMSFSITKSSIGVEQIRLRSKEVMLDGSWNTDGKIEGALAIDIASETLNQSTSFHKLLTLTGIKKPYINFSFLLGGIPKNTRIMWLKGEFKDRIKEELPASIKISIENKLDELVDELENQ